MSTLLILLPISLHTPWGVYCEIYPLLKVICNKEELKCQYYIVKNDTFICIVTRGGIYCEI